MSAVYFGRQQYFPLLPFFFNQAKFPGSSETMVQIYPSKNAICFQTKKRLNVETGGRFKSDRVLN